MTSREIIHRGFKRGLQLFRNITGKQKSNEVGSITKNAALQTVKLGDVQLFSKSKRFSQLVTCSKRLWVSPYSNFLSFSAALRRRAGWHFLSTQFGRGHAVPLFGLIGFSMVSSSGIGLITHNDEYDAMCEKIRIAIQEINLPKPIDEETVSMKTLKNFSIGSVIAKGCNAVVYSAKEKSTVDNAPANNASHEENVHILPTPHQDEESDYSKNSLALKMMFNYDAESNAPHIYQAMFKETLPTKYLMTSKKSDLWRIRPFLKALPYHPNVIDMKYAFVDYVPSLPDQLQLYPQALPTRLNEDGCGHNMTLFLVMKRYHKNLREYLENYHPTSKVRLLLLVQLLEAVYHLTKHGIAHRDLKSDNILLDLSDGPLYPKLVITDFGCCCVDLQIPFPSYLLDQRQGNVAMMAPEISSALPGRFSVIDYKKADLWAVGALAYEIYDQRNPFYGTKSHKRLDSRTYRHQDLPALANDVPLAIEGLIKNILDRDPSKRIDCNIAANVCHLILFAPSHWLCSLSPLPGKKIVTNWLVLLAMSCASTPITNVIEEMKKLFLRRVKLDDVMVALSFIRSYTS